VGIFIAPESITQAVWGLQASSAGRNFGAFLAVKRALNLDKPIGRPATDAQCFGRPITEIFGRTDADPAPFLNVFGPEAVESSEDWFTPGSAEFLGRFREWGIFESSAVEDDALRLRSGYEKDLKALVHLGSSTAMKPSIVHVATWIFRRKDLATISVDRGASDNQIVGSLIGALGLSTAEVRELFSVPSGIGVPTISIATEDAVL
jgi:hypothetical protein